jgi:7,8-dihydropterin-6-yl-methyl-4-(beta-D-ribofuranosyl)aminobenzene 5'-phosphate synthase
MGTFVRYPPHGETPKLIPMPELSLSLSTESGQILVVGCSHSSVETIVEAASAQSQEPIALVAGGYHLLPYPRAEVRALAERLKAQHGVQAVAPCHCSGHVAFDEFRRAYGEAYLPFGLGDRIER